MNGIAFGQLAVFSIFLLDATRWMKYNMSKSSKVANAVTNDKDSGKRIWKYVSPETVVELIEGEKISE